jgi:hypothetical protein
MKINAERRTHVRFRLEGSVLLEDERQAHHYFYLTDLSAGGCRITGGATPRLRSSVQLRIRFSNGEHAEADATVCSADYDIYGASTIGLQFDGLRPEVQRNVADVLIDGLNDTPAVLVIHPDHDERLALKHTLERLGRRAHLTCCFADALITTSSPGEDFDTLIVDQTTALRHLREINALVNRKSLRPIVVQDHRLMPGEEKELMSVAESLVPLKCSPQTLYRALGG